MHATIHPVYETKRKCTNAHEAIRPTTLDLIRLMQKYLE
jgi:DNA topoisomerase IA